METSNDPATERQLNYLKRFGFTLGAQPLTQDEAEHLISDLEAFRRLQAGTSSPAATKAGLLAHQYRLAVQHARLALAEADQESMPDFQENLNRAITARQEFWMDTCREAARMHSATAEVLELYQAHGCRFCVPTHAQVEDILEALDSVIAFWDRDHPELFYQTLELNFPELLIQR